MIDVVQVPPALEMHFFWFDHGLVEASISDVVQPLEDFLKMPLTCKRS